MPKRTEILAEAAAKLARFDAAVAAGTPEVEALTQAGFAPRDANGTATLLNKVRARRRLAAAITALPLEQQELARELWRLVKDARAKPGTRLSALRMLNTLARNAASVAAKPSGAESLPEFADESAAPESAPAAARPALPPPSSVFVARQSGEISDAS